MPSPKVAEWANCNLRYVAETKLARLDDGDLLELRRLLTAKLGRPTAHLATNGPVAREGMISEIMDLKKDLSKLPVEPAGLSPPPPKEQRRVSFEKPHEEHDAQGGADEKEEKEEAVRKVVKDALEKVEQNVTEKATEPLPDGVTEDQVERVKALIALKAAAELEPPPPPESKKKQEAAPTDEPLVVQKHQLRICSFNALKLRLSNPTGKAPNEDDDDENSVGYKGSDEGEQLTRKWLMLAAVMSSYDVIVMQEIPGRKALCEARMRVFHDMLHLATEPDSQWTAVHSRVSGKDGKTEGPGAEVHVAFVKSPVTMVQVDTLFKVGATRLDYAPLQLLLHDPRFADPADRDYVLSSVHLPPRDRADARDDQLSALLRHYSAVDTSEYRMQKPFRPNKETKCAPMHIIAGDFNAFPGKLDANGEEVYGLTKAGFVTKVPEGVATTPSGQHYDNFLTPEWCDDQRIVGAGVLQLTSEQNSREGKIGISDHWPITLTIIEATKTKAAASSTGKCAPPPPPAKSLPPSDPCPPEEAAEAAAESPPPSDAAPGSTSPTPAPAAPPAPDPPAEPQVPAPLAQSLAPELAPVEPPPVEVEAPCAELAMVELSPAAPCADLATSEPEPAPPCTDLATPEPEPAPHCTDLATPEPGPVAPREALAIADLLQLDPELPAAAPPAPSLGEVAASTDPSVQMELASLLMEPVPELMPVRRSPTPPTPPSDKEDCSFGGDPTDLP